MVNRVGSKILYSNDETGNYCSFTEATPDIEGYCVRLFRTDDFKNSIEWFDVKNNNECIRLPRQWEPT